MAAIARGSSASESAQKFNIPRRTSRNHTKSGSVQKVTRRRQILSSEQEGYLCIRIFQLQVTGMPIAAKVVRSSVYNYCEMDLKINLFNANEMIAEKNWLQLFLKRYHDAPRQKA
jgi:hypothetical protein